MTRYIVGVDRSKSFILALFNYLFFYLNDAGNPRLHLKELGHVTSCSGDPSLQNALEMAMRALRYSPSINGELR